MDGRARATLAYRTWGIPPRGAASRARPRAGSVSGQADQTTPTSPTPSTATSLAFFSTPPSAVGEMSTKPSSRQKALASGSKNARVFLLQQLTMSASTRDCDRLCPRYGPAPGAVRADPLRVGDEPDAKAAALAAARQVRRGRCGLRCCLGRRHVAFSRTWVRFDQDRWCGPRDGFEAHLCGDGRCDSAVLRFRSTEKKAPETCVTHPALRIFREFGQAFATICKLFHYVSRAEWHFGRFFYGEDFVENPLQRTVTYPDPILTQHHDER